MERMKWRYGADSKYRAGDLVYLMQSRDTGLYKIGKTQNLRERLGRICLYQNELVEVIAYLDGYTALESALHLAFGRHRWYTSGHPSDWFDPDPSILEWFQKYAIMWEDAPLFSTDNIAVRFKQQSEQSNP